jgi:hypothetical protein
VVISAGAEGGREDDTGSVDRLPDVDKVDTTGHLLDQNRGETLGAQLLVDTEEVDLGGVKGSKKCQPS